ncbi:MAG: hypothetical protein EXS36_11350 [Pedosphaera sp.]|nr:hypothetical protein [Pedosphaera sp.]
MNRRIFFVRLMLAALLFMSAGPAESAELISATATWRFFPGHAEASSPDHTAWRRSQFDDRAWAAGPAPFFFGESFTGTELRDMPGHYSSVYLRHTFTVEDPPSIGELTLHVLSDDGFVAWINGKEIARYNVPDGELSATALSGPALPEPLAYEDLTLPEPWKLLVPGKNVLAIHAFNASLNSPDFILVASGEIVRDTQAPVVIEQVPPAGSTVDELTHVEVIFSEPVVGVDANDLLINGTPAESVRQPTPTHFVFSFSQPATGAVKFAWADGNGITDVLGAPHPLTVSDWTVKLDPAGARRNLVISEFMADNDKTLFDTDCDNPDWIEIFNSGTADVNLQGWSLTDDPANTGKWRFPDYTLAGGSYLVVFASAKNKTTLPTIFGALCRSRTNKIASFHTNFKLSNNGGYLALAAPDGEVISEFSPAYPAQRRDVSYGKVPGSDKLAYFTLSTPQGLNSASGAGFTPAVRYSHPTGTALQPFQLTLDCPAIDAVIRYTRDGSFPAESNANLLSYTGPITISNVVQIRTRAFAPGLLPSAPKSETYLMLTNAPVNYATLTSSLPIVVLSTLKTATISSSKNTTVHISFYEPVRGLSSLRNPPTLTTRGAIKIRGSSTEGQPQSNFAVDFWDEFDQDHDLEPFGMPADSEFVLYAPNVYDPPLIHNSFTMEVSRQMNFYAPRTRFVEVYLNKGGVIASNQWQGVYIWMEKPGLSKGRVDAPKAQPEDVLPPDVTGSYMFKTDRLDPGDVGFSAGGNAAAYVEPKEREMKSAQRAPQIAYLSKYFKDMDNALKSTNPNFRDPILGYKNYLNLTNWMDFHILETLSGQADAIRLSTYFYKRRNGKIEYGPRWDYDRAWESKGDDRDNNPRIWDTGGGLFGPPWWSQLLKDTDAWQVWIDRWQEFRKGPLSLGNMYSVIDRMTNELRWSQPREAKRWPDTLPRGGYPNEIRIMKTWISNRVAYFDGQMAQPPLLSSLGAVVTPGFQLQMFPPASVSSPANVTIYYTLDGTDPRPSTGTGIITGFKYEGPITINANSRVVARVRDTGRNQRQGQPPTLPRLPSSTPWSSGVVATFVVTPPPLVLTEIMFHPDTPTGSLIDPAEYEYLELKNVSDHALDLRGYHFTDGIEFRFTAASAVQLLAPGARVLVVRNHAAFLSRYPGVGNVAGEFTGSLADDGERLALAGPVEEPIFEITYGDQWQRLADGLGFSLVLRDETTPPAAIQDKSLWRLSASHGGSPGVPDPLPLSIPQVLVNEVQPQALSLGGDSRVELLNIEKSPVDISGWWLSDNFKEPRKARLPAKTRLAAGGFLVLRETVFNLPNGAGFSINSRGDAVWLFSADAEGNLTGWAHGFEFGALQAEQSFGRYVNGAEVEQFPVQKSASLGAPNPGPQRAVVAIAEIMYHPPDAGSSANMDDEFIELQSSSDAAIPLYDPLRPANAWRVRGGADFDFPPNTFLPTHGRIVLVGFDPSLNPLRLESLRRRAGWNPAVPVTGPWQGHLSNDKGTIRLERPGIPIVDLDGAGAVVPYYTVDQVRYETRAPWPTEAAGTGASLLRRNIAEYGDEPANWLAAARLPTGIDMDDDSLPDLWESAFQLSTLSGTGDNGPEGDDDRDGFTNRHEYLNGTDPSDPTSGLRVSISFGPGEYVNLFLAATAGRQFRVESRASLQSGDWASLKVVTADSNGSAFLGSFPAPVDATYFRVVVP